MRISDWSSDVCSSDLDPLIGAFDESVAIVIDNAVAVENGKFHCTSREMSASWFIPACKLASSASRFARTSGSSADRKSVVEGTRVSVRVDLGGRSRIKKKKQKKNQRIR